MKNKIIIIYIILLSRSLSGYELIEQEICPCNKNNASQKYFSLSSRPLHQERIITDPLALLKAVEETLLQLSKSQCLRKYVDIITQNNKDKFINNPLTTDQLLTKKTKKTLEFIRWTIKNDIKNNRPFRILDPEFLNTHFTFMKWQPDKESAKKRKVDLENPEHIRVTKYAVFKAPGSLHKTDTLNCPLYSIVDNENGEKMRYRFTKQEVLNGALTKEPYLHIFKPLVWLTREGLEEALMQGTIYVEIPNHSAKIFNVDKNNGIPYNQKLKNRRNQKRYWYFKEIQDPAHPSSQNFIINHAQTMFAGDLYNIGLGKIILLQYLNPITKKPEIRIGILTDTGGAFVDNLYQLDYFAGIFDTRNDLFSSTKHFPQHAQAYILVKKVG
jgi:hypothetical protein